MCKEGVNWHEQQVENRGARMTKTVDLIVVSGVDAGKIYAIPECGVVLGRSHSCDICLEDGALSRQHCRLYFADDKLMLQDLLSSNGTLVNGNAVCKTPVQLHHGDVIALGSWVFRVGGSGEVSAMGAAPSANIPTHSLFETDASVQERSGSIASSEMRTDGQQADLFTASSEKMSEASQPVAEKRRFILWISALLFLLSAGGILYLVRGGEPEEVRTPRQLPRVEKEAEFSYERTMIDAQHLFRYILVYDFTSNILSLDVDDLGEQDRSFSKRLELSSEGKKALISLLMEADLASIGELFPERSHDGITLEQRRLTIVRNRAIWQRVAENVQNKDFNALCDKLEFFARNELQVWAAQYSVAELEALAREQLSIADRYWEQRDLGDDKVWLAIAAYKKGLSALETLNPKPDCLAALSAGLQQSETLLSQRYEAVLFEIDQAMNTQRYDVAESLLRKILQMIPDRDDARNQQASERLLIVEQRRGGDKGGR